MPFFNFWRSQLDGEKRFWKLNFVKYSPKWSLTIFHSTLNVFWFKNKSIFKKLGSRSFPICWSKKANAPKVFKWLVPSIFEIKKKHKQCVSYLRGRISNVILARERERHWKTFILFLKTCEKDPTHWMKKMFHFLLLYTRFYPWN